jgi:uroporphyrin-III C-methyltransferase
MKQGILVVGHGSRRAEANDDIRNAARKIQEQGHFEMVEAAFLEIEEPDIAAGVTRLIEQGAGHIIVHPYFLSPGRHTRGDIPVEVEAAAQHFGVTYQITEPLAAHPSVIEASVDRISITQRDNFKSNSSFNFPKVSAETGVVYLVGAGPGDPELLTVKAHNLLASAETVIYDNLVNPEILELVRPNAYRIYVGKIGGGRQSSQAEINRLLILRARSGEKVVRLKGGDPFVYGRGGEEALALQEAGINFEIVPGISSAVAVPAYAGIPLTHRSLSRSVTILTGAEAGDGSCPESIAKQTGQAETVVILMGMKHLRKIAADFIAAGRPADLPVAVIRWGTYADQQTVTGTLETIADEVEREKLRSPGVIVIGQVVSLREKLNWFEKKSVDVLDQDLFVDEVQQQFQQIFAAVTIG